MTGDLLLITEAAWRPNSLGGGDRDLLGLWTSTGGDVENCTGVA